MVAYWIALLTLLFSATALASPAQTLESLISRSRELKLSENIQWVRLLHYRKSVLGGMKSEADGASFFLSPEGKTNPQAELEATLRGFYSEKKYGEKEQHPRCQFPARYEWLRSQLSIDPAQLPPADCTRFEKFRAAMAAKSVTVVFSSYFLNNPSSSFGHSFLRLNKAERPRDGRHFELLDYGINYAAVSDEANALLYMFKGLLGFLPGTFTSIPYYYKVREYNDYETRDLWEYDLNLTQEQIDRLVAHFWELGSTYFDYYYLNENCSYHVLTSLEAANPALTLTQRQSWVVIPVDTIKVLLSEPGLVRGTHYRPSIRSILAQRLKGLSPQETDALDKLIHEKGAQGLPANLSPEQRVHVLDAGMDYLDFKYSHALVEEDPVATQWKQNLLLARSELLVPSQEVQVPAPTQEVPQSGHDSRRAILSPGYNNQLGTFETLSYRFALHDLLDPRVGYPEYAQIEMFSFRGRHNHRDASFWLDEAKLAEVISLTPLERFMKRPSWRMEVGTRRFYDGTCDFCYGANVEVGGGISQKPFDSIPISYFVFVEGEESASSHFQGSHFKTGIGPAAAIRFHLSDNLLALLHGHYRYQFFVDRHDTYQLDFGARWGFAKHWALDARGAIFTTSREAALGIAFYH